MTRELLLALMAGGGLIFALAWLMWPKPITYSELEHDERSLDWRAREAEGAE